MCSSPSSEKDHPGTIVMFANTLLKKHVLPFLFPSLLSAFSASKIPPGNLSLSSTPQLLKSQMLFQWQLVIKMPVLTLFSLKRISPLVLQSAPYVLTLSEICPLQCNFNACP